MWRIVVDESTDDDLGEGRERGSAKGIDGLDV